MHLTGSGESCFVETMLQRCCNTSGTMLSTLNNAYGSLGVLRRYTEHVIGTSGSIPGRAVAQLPERACACRRPYAIAPRRTRRRGSTSTRGVLRLHHVAYSNVMQPKHTLARAHHRYLHSL